MVMLIAGLLLWSLAHLFKTLAPDARARLRHSLPKGADRAVMALLILAGLAMIVLGWRSAVPEPVYDPPAWGRHATMALMILAVWLAGSAHGQSRVRQVVRHPMLVGAVIWAIGHLLANGDSRALVLFGGIGLWAMLSIIAINARAGAWVKPAGVAPWGREILGAVIALAVYFLLVLLHPWFAGVAIIP